jgi:nucleotide-binding universal stress UspA family protein
VHGATRKLPSVALAAVDFGEASVRAAREAIMLLEPPGRLHLVHVKWSYNMTSFADSEWEHAYAAGAEAEFARVRGLLGSRPGIEVTSALLTGGVVERLLGDAAAIRADVLALGSRNQNVFDRLMIGSTPAQVLRAASCSVLIAPAIDAKP